MVWYKALCWSPLYFRLHRPYQASRHAHKETCGHERSNHFDGSKAYRVFNPATRKVQVSRDVIFDEEKTWNWDDAAIEDHPTGGDDMFIVTYTQANPIGHDHSGEHAGGDNVDDDPGHSGPGHGNGPGFGSAPGTPTARTPSHESPSSPSSHDGAPWWGEEDEGTAADDVIDASGEER